jgi:trehalose 6-phosphate synthase
VYVFRALGVGEEGILVAAAAGRPTAARWRLPGPEPVAALLAWIASARREEATPPLRAAPVPVVAFPRGRPSTAPSQDLLVISNRLPELRTPSDPGEGRVRNVGGLVSALEPVLSARRGLWLGWSGRTLRDAEAPAVGLDADARPSLAWVDLPEEWVETYYRGFCNRALWPLLHSFPGRVRFSDDEWASYERVNESFAEVAADLVSPSTPIWVHDFHLLLVARALRQRGHRGPLGLFLHVPFPGPETFSILPWAERLLDGMLDHDLIGFQTPGYVENFRQCIGALTPARGGDDAIEHRGRRVRLRALPIGILPEDFQGPPDPRTAEEVAALLASISPTRLVLGVDRLDYTKGIPERLEAFGRLFQLFPEWRGKVSLVQVSVPSRADVPEYAEQRRLIEGVVGRVNGEFGEAHWVPVRYLYRSYGRGHLAQLYRAADVGYVTPLRDGLNLVAKEYVAAQAPANPGVLVLSRFAGAAVELKDAVLTNPWHPDGMARDLDRALRMPLEERRDRHARLLAAVSRTTALTWAEEFLDALGACG